MMTQQKLLKTMVTLEGDIIRVDTIEHEGKLWLVPGWIDSPSEGWSSPERIILLDELPHQRMAPGNPADWVLNCPMPKAVFAGQIPKQSPYRFVVLERPDIKFHIPAGVH